MIGRTGTLSDRDKRESFERFREHLWNPEVVAYDELYRRAEFIVARTTDSGPEHQAVPEPGDDRSWEDDLPF